MDSSTTLRRQRTAPDDRPLPATQPQFAHVSRELGLDMFDARLRAALRHREATDARCHEQAGDAEFCFRRGHEKLPDQRPA